MKNFVATIILLLIAYGAVGQEDKLIAAFKAGIVESLDSNYTEVQSRYFSYIVEPLRIGNSFVLEVRYFKPDTIKISKRIIAKALTLKYDLIYRNNILKLINGTPSQRNTGYMLITFFKDTTYYEELWRRFDGLNSVEDNAAVLYPWMMKLFPRETDKVFEVVMRHREWYDVTLVPSFMVYMDQQSVITTLYKHLTDTSFYVRDIALNTIALVDTSTRGDSVVITALNAWPIDEKKSAVVALQMRTKLRLKQLLEPYVKQPVLHEVIAEALYLSSYWEDGEYADEFCTRGEHVMYSEKKVWHLLELKALRQQLFDN